MNFSKGKFMSAKRKSAYTKLTVCIVFVVVILFSVFNDYRNSKAIQEAVAKLDGYFSVHYIDVGQGDATLLRSPDGDFMLIDCGPTSSSDYLTKYLWDMGVDELEYLIITHPHEDHYGGAEQIMENFPVEGLILHRDFANVYPYDDFIDIANDKNTEVILVQKGDSFSFDDCSDFEIISPEKADIRDFNQSSLSFRVVYGDTAFMFTGDSERPNERYMLSSGKPLEAQVLKAGHHGSSSSNMKSFVKAVSPEYAVVSCEKDNSYGHPHRETVSVFDELDVEMLVTYEDGSIIFLSDGEGITYDEKFSKTISGNNTESLIDVLMSIFSLQ